jgi:hypothetical protein
VDANEENPGFWTGTLHGSEVCAEIGPHRLSIILKVTAGKKGLHIETDDNDSVSVVDTGQEEAY